jgi:hypothetical protein
MATFKRSRVDVFPITVRAGYGAVLGWINETGQFLHDCQERAPLSSDDLFQIGNFCRLVLSTRKDDKTKVSRLPQE